MDYKNWMSCIKDEVKITEVIMPGCHNAGTRGMGKTSCCQDGTLYEQFCYGVREFGLFYKVKRGKLLLAHGLACGAPLEEALKSIAQIIAEDGNEFIIIDMRRYSDQTIGPIKLRYEDNKELTNELIEKYLQPSKYAFTDFDKISEVTMGDLRRSGKKYLLCNPERAYAGSVDCKIYGPWSAEVFGYRVEKFVREDLKFFEKEASYDFFWFQTQQTPNLGTENGIRKWPRELDNDLRPYFKGMMQAIADNPAYLKKANIIAGDFMTRDHMKVNEILRLNLVKDTVIADRRAEFEAALKND